MAAAAEFSPRVEVAGPGSVVCDLTGVERLFGDPATIAAELRREAAARGIPARVAVAATRTAALLTAHARAGITVIAPGDEARTLAPLSVRVLDALLNLEASRIEQAAPPAARFYRTSPMEDLARQRAAARRRTTAVRLRTATRETLNRHERLLGTLERWGIRTLGDLAALPSSQLAARLGADGPIWQRIARGEDEEPLVPCGPEERFEEHLELEWPIDALEPLSFVLGRVLDPLCAHLERRDRAAATLIIELRLVSRETFTRRLQLPAPVRDPRVLRTLALLDLDVHPPRTGIDAVTVRIEPTPGRVLQYSLLERARPAPEQVSTLLARLTALMGQDRCGSPQVLDTFRPGAFTLRPFVADGEGIRPLANASEVTLSAPGQAAVRASSETSVALRRFRRPVPIRVAGEAHRPARIMADRLGVAGGRVDACAGPWHTSGEWWAPNADDKGTPHPAVGDTTERQAGVSRPMAWNHAEWDIALEDGTMCRIFQDRDTYAWFMEGVID
jgi:nucleotidyltransferase/DNA polymerase involved in DNA repair